MTIKEDMTMPITIEKARLNIWNIGAAFIGIAATAFGWGITYANVSAGQEKMQAQIADVRNLVNVETQARKDRGLQTDANFKDIREQLPIITQQSIRLDRTSEVLGELKNADKALNDRVDRVVESFGGKLDNVLDGMNKLTTRVEVIATQVGAPPPARRTRMTAIQTMKEMTQ